MSSLTESDDIWHVEDLVPDDATLGQGDLIRFGKSSPFTYGIVVTADCDLDKRKHSRIITYVPLVSEFDAVRTSLIHDLVSKREAQAREVCMEHFKLDRSSAIPVETQLYLALKDRGALGDEVATSHATPQELLALLLCGHYPEPTIDQCKLVVSALGMEWTKAVDAFENQLAARGDFLALSAPPLVKERVTVAWLRGVRQSQLSAIALRTSEAARADKEGLRIGKLRSPYIYRLTQMLGQVFSDIGLPDLPKLTIDRGV